ncbi:MAG: metallophosphoesterase [Candidatus Eisenbacteria bacterium]|nr:metallophosphoesterase [Candidatus Eisenbacteria bacterium]
MIGDVHACASELERLLEVLAPGDGDRVIFVGDLVDRGPDIRRAFELVRSVRGELVLGNHEDKLLRWRDGRPGEHGTTVRLAPHHKLTVEALRPEDWVTMESARPFVELPEHDTLVVHGGLRPGVPPSEQDPYDLCRLQCVGPTGRRRKMGTEGAWFWAERCDYPGRVVYGHTVFREPHRVGRTLGIDTGCCFGGCLTAVELPGERLHQVKAERNYAWEMLQEFYPMRAEAVRRRFGLDQAGERREPAESRSGGAGGEETTHHDEGDRE